MCNFYHATLPGESRGYLSGVKLNIPDDYAPSRKVFPAGESPIIYLKDGELVTEISSFKLVPYFAKDLSHKYSTMNARDDKLKKKSMWTPYFEKKRCLVPVVAFYEHHTLSSKQVIEGHDKPTNKVPYRISIKSQDLFCFAGMYNSWKDPDTGEEKLSHAIITTDPNETVRKIHNSKERMAVILPESAYATWTDPDRKGEDLFNEGLIQPWPDEDIIAYQISKAFDHDFTGVDITKPVENPIEI